MIPLKVVIEERQKKKNYNCKHVIYGVVLKSSIMSWWS